MEWNVTGNAKEWAVLTYGSVRLGDERRTKRAIQVASALASDPMHSFPTQLKAWGGVKALYRLLASPTVSYEKLMRPHIQQTRELMASKKRVLLIQDMTEIDYSHHPKTEGLGPIGNGSHQGYLLQTVLAVDPSTRAVMGIAAQEPFLRQPAPAGETSHERDRRRDKESQVWLRQVQSLGTAPAGKEYIHVGDRGSDIFTLLRQCQKQGCGFVVRVQHNRRVDLLVDQGETPLAPGVRRYGRQRSKQAGLPHHLFEEVRSWPQQSEQAQVVRLDGNQKRKQREVSLSLAWGRLRLWPPDGEVAKVERPMVVTVVRAWEANPPEGEKAVEWLLLTSVKVENEQQAWERVQWYQMRWIVEDYHQGLKTGCQIEARQVQSYEQLRTTLGFLAPLGVRLLQIRDAARSEPERLAQEVLPAEVVMVVAHLAHVAPSHLTTRACWRRIAQQGGFLARKGDGDPGWKTLWRGWLSIQTLLQGVHLADQLVRE